MARRRNEGSRSPTRIGSLLESALPRLRSFIRFHATPLVRSRESTADIAQSVCREILLHGERFRHGDEEAFRTWLFTTAKRKILDRLRYYHAAKRDVGREIPQSAQEPGGAPPAGPRCDATPSGAVILREEMERFERAFESLPQDYRLVISLSRVEGLSHADVAEVLGRSEGAVRKLLHRALARLERLMR